MEVVMSEAQGATQIKCLDYKQWMGQWPWTHVAHLVFNHDKANISQAEQLLKKWRLGIIKGEHLQLATIGVLNHIPSSHLHVLLIGTNRNGKTLNDLKAVDWCRYARLWPGSAKIDPIFSEGIYGYINDMNTPDGNHELLRPYNLKLLKLVQGQSRKSIQQDCCMPGTCRELVPTTLVT
jgi:hypothetical protein